MKGWVLDVRPDHERDLMDVWIMDSSPDRTMMAHRFRPVMKAAGSREDLRKLRRYLSDMEGVHGTELRTGFLDVQDRRERDHLDITISRYSLMTEIARSIEAFGSYRDYSLFDVDLRLPTRYMHMHGIFPLARIQLASSFRVLDDDGYVENPLPPMRAMLIDVVPDRKGPVAGMSDPIRSVRAGDVFLEGEKEDRMIMAVVDEIRRRDPDILVTHGGDTFVLPYLHERAHANELAPYLKLDRSGKPFRAGAREGRSYFTYGQVRYRPPFHTLKGRLHLDLANSFMLREGGLVGVSLLSRMSLLPIQLMSRLSPGSAISYMECVEALKRGRAVRWKKNDPENWKSAVELSASDRGGHIFDPIVGAYSNVIEMDFSSFYPHIILKKNLSVETLNCPCCPGERGSRVPGLPYHFCTRKEGLIPSVVGEVLERRLGYKSAFRDGKAPGPFPGEEGLGPVRPPGDAERYRQASNTLKWVLVTCFGYTGYRNARFGRIEVHESVTAHARELLLRAKDIAEEHGLEILHGIVDSLWLRGGPGRAGEAASAIREETGIPIDVDTVYRWLVFLPNKTNGAGALNRYYGLRDDGTFKFRGIASRQRSTPVFLKRALEETLEALSGAGSAEEIPEHLPKAFGVAREKGRMIIEREVDPRDLAITIRPSKELDGYTTRSEHVAAMRLLKRAGENVKGGQKVSFVVLDHDAARPENRVALVEENMEGTRYDAGRYLELLARFTAQALAVFGVTERHMLRILKGVSQKDLSSYERLHER